MTRNAGLGIRLISLAASLVGLPLLASGGEVSGLPTSLPPGIRPDFILYMGNDFLSPGNNDDYRTQQFTLSGRFSDRLTASFDLSIFTLPDLPGTTGGRIDTMTWSAGYELLRRDTDNDIATFSAGGLVRSIGNFDGARIQNGFHRLTVSDPRQTPYTSTRSTDPGAWAFGEYSRTFREARDDRFWTGWDLGLWLRGGALGTTAGQVDGVAGAYVLAQRPGFDMWAGIRRDWRRGYDDDPVLEQSAAQEDTAALAWGLRWGSLVIETVARQDSDASYGQLSFVSSAETRGSSTGSPGRGDLQLALQPPHMTFQVAYRHGVDYLSNWREAWLVEFRGGQPQLGQDTSRFVETYQLTVGYELGRAFATRDWLRWYMNASAGVRSERLTGRAELQGENAGTVEAPVVAAELGLEIDAARLSPQWEFRLRLGVTGWYPFGDETVQIGDEPSELLQPDASLVLGWVLSRR